MKYGVLLAFVAVLVLIPLVSPMSDGADETPMNYYIRGYVADTDRNPMEGVEVSVTDAYGTYSADTDEAGLFSVGTTYNTNLTISFSFSGYTLLTCPSSTSPSGSDPLTLSLSGATYDSRNRTYTLSTSVNDMRCTIMKASQGVVTGQVFAGTTPITGATVTLTPSVGGEDAFSASTDDRGYYEVTCPTGEYLLSVSRQGFNPNDPFTVIVTEIEGSPKDVQLVKTELKKYLGLDVAHILMLIGVIVSILVAVAAWFLSKRMNRPHGVEIIDDSPEEEEDDLRNL